MAALGDVSKQHDNSATQGAMGLVIPAWPDVSQSIPDEANTPPPGSSGFPGYFSFS